MKKHPISRDPSHDTVPEHFREMDESIGPRIPEGSLRVCASSLVRGFMRYRSRQCRSMVLSTPTIRSINS
jgi:hypothetical protein